MLYYRNILLHDGRSRHKVVQLPENPSTSSQPSIALLVFYRVQNIILVLVLSEIDSCGVHEIKPPESSGDRLERG